MMIPLIVLIVVFTAVLAVPSFANSERAGKFWTDDRIYTDLFNAGIASELKDRCANIHVRHIRGMIFLQSLYTYARRQGHSLQEIRTFIQKRRRKSPASRLGNHRVKSAKCGCGRHGGFLRLWY